MEFTLTVHPYLNDSRFDLSCILTLDDDTLEPASAKVVLKYFDQVHNRYNSEEKNYLIEEDK